MLNYSTILQRPERSPIEVPILVRSYYEGKSVVDIGCACGDLIPLWAHYAKSVIGFESDESRYQIAANRPDVVALNNVKLVCARATPADLPAADFYYYWDTRAALFSLVEEMQQLKMTGAVCAYAGIAPRDYGSFPTAFRIGAFDTQSEVENWADEIIYFKSSEKDGRPEFDQVAEHGELIICIKHL